MIRREGGRNGTVEFHCDDCSESLATHQDDFGKALAAARADGWAITKVGNDWVHTCGSCAEDHRIAARG
jgi:hypothetical protein